MGAWYNERQAHTSGVWERSSAMVSRSGQSSGARTYVLIVTAFLPDTGTLPGWDGWVPQSISFRGRVIYCVMLMAVDGILPMIITSYRRGPSRALGRYLSTIWVVSSAGVFPAHGLPSFIQAQEMWIRCFSAPTRGRHYYSCLLSSLLYCHHRGHRPFLRERNMQNSPGALSLSSEGENLQEHRKGVDRPYPCCWRCLRMGPVR